MCCVWWWTLGAVPCQWHSHTGRVACGCRLGLPRICRTCYTCAKSIAQSLVSACRHQSVHQLGHCMQATDHAADASIVELPVQAGDLIIAGSDGLWDNTPEAEILQHLPSSPDEAGQVLPSGMCVCQLCQLRLS